MRSRLGPRLRAMWADCSGATALMVPAVTLVLLIVSAFVIDLSQFYLLKRRQQSMTDLAAMAAAVNLGAAGAAVNASLLSNMVPASDLRSVELGIYTPDPAIPAALRFVPGSVAANAVRVTLRSQHKGSFRAFVGGAGASLTTQAVAATNAVADFAVMPPLPGIDPAIANGILGALIGSNLNLATADYLGLGSVNVDLFALANAVADRSGVTGCYADLGRASVRLADVFYALATVLSGAGAPPVASGAMRAIASATSFVGPRLTFGNLVAFNAYSGRSLGASSPVAAPVPVLPFVMAAARLAAATASNTISATATGLASGLPGLTLRLATNIPLGVSSYAAIGPTGTVVRTLQTRAALTLQVPAPSPLPTLSLALYFQNQAATARVATISGAGSTASVILGIVPGTFDAWIGSVPDASLTNWAATPRPGAAPLMSSPLLTVSASAYSTSGTTSETRIAFSAADIAACRMKTVTGSTFLAPFTSLLSSLQMQVTVLGFSFGTQSEVVSSVSGALQAQMQPIVDTVNATMSLLGLTLGDVGSWVCAVRAGQAAVVN